MFILCAEAVSYPIVISKSMAFNDVKSLKILYFACEEALIIIKLKVKEDG